TLGPMVAVSRPAIPLQDLDFQCLQQLQGIVRDRQIPEKCRRVGKRASDCRVVMRNRGRPTTIVTCIRQGTIVRPSMSLTAGTRLGPYEIVEPLGAGGMGEVYRARDTRLDRTVAIKILPPHLSESVEAKQRFDREAR